MPEIVDLCVGSSSEEEEEQPKLPSPRAATRKSEAIISLLDDDDDDDDSLSGPSFRKSSAASGNAQAKEPLGQVHKNHQSLATPVVASAKKKRVAPASTIAASKKSADKVKRKKTGLAIFDDDSDDDDMDWLGKPSGLSAFSRADVPTPSAAAEHGKVPRSALKTPRAAASAAVSSASVTFSSKQVGSAFKTPSANPYAGATSEEKRAYRRSLQAVAAAKATPSPVKPMEFDYPVLNANPKKYPDMRVYYAYCFWQHGRGIGRHSFEIPKLTNLSRRVILLALMEDPIRSVEEYTSFGTTSVTQAVQQRTTMLEDISRGDKHWITPATGPDRDRKFYTIAEACLGSLLDHVQSEWKQRSGYNGTRLPNASDEERKSWLLLPEAWLPLQQLIGMVDDRLRKDAPGRLTRRQDDDRGAAYYVNSETRTNIEFAQVKGLEGSPDGKGPRIKRHKRKGETLYELLPFGYDTAIQLRDRLYPLPPGPYRCTKLANCIPSVQPKYQGIILGVDNREGGGGNNILHGICNKLDLMKVPYFVASLSIGDYCFFTTSSTGRHLLCPIIVERKSVQDLAMSIYDGRWKRQKHRMYVGQYVFGYDDCRMVYIVEGNEKKESVSGGYVGARHFDVDQNRLHEEIENLNEEGFDVLKTPSVENTMFELARWATRVAEKVRNGELVAKYSYQEFRAEVKKVGNRTDFSRIAKDRRRQRLEREKNAASVEEIDSSDDELLDSKVKASGSPSKPQQKNDAKSKQAKIKKNDDGYDEMTQKQLQQACVAVGLPKTAKSRNELVERLRGPHPPKVWLERKLKKLYVPARHDVGGAALLVGLYLAEEENIENPDYAGMTKEELYVKAEGLNLTKNPFSGGTTQVGPYHYDGWSTMGSLMTGDPALVCRKKGGRYQLTRNGGDLAGFPLAKAIHTWCHELGTCHCGGE